MLVIPDSQISTHPDRPSTGNPLLYRPLHRIQEISQADCKIFCQKPHKVDHKVSQGEFSSEESDSATQIFLSNLSKPNSFAHFLQTRRVVCCSCIIEQLSIFPSLHSSRRAFNSFLRAERCKAVPFLILLIAYIFIVGTCRLIKTCPCEPLPTRFTILKALLRKRKE